MDVLGYGGEIAVRYKHLADKVRHTYKRANRIEYNITAILANVSNLRKDLSTFTELATVIVKNKHMIIEFFPFIKETKKFIGDAKKCIDRYDVFPEMQ